MFQMFKIERNNILQNSVISQLDYITVILIVVLFKAKNLFRIPK